MCKREVKSPPHAGKFSRRHAKNSGMGELTKCGVQQAQQAPKGYTGAAIDRWKTEGEVTFKYFGKGLVAGARGSGFHDTNLDKTLSKTQGCLNINRRNFGKGEGNKNSTNGRKICTGKRAQKIENEKDRRSSDNSGGKWGEKRDLVKRAIRKTSRTVAETPCAA